MIVRRIPCVRFRSLRNRSGIAASIKSSASDRGINWCSISAARLHKLINCRLPVSPLPSSSPASLSLVSTRLNSHQLHGPRPIAIIGVCFRSLPFKLQFSLSRGASIAFNVQATTEESKSYGVGKHEHDADMWRKKVTSHCFDEFSLEKVATSRFLLVQITKNWLLSITILCQCHVNSVVVIDALHRYNFCRWSAKVALAGRRAGFTGCFFNVKRVW